MKIAILGFGHVGQQLAKLFTRSGYEVVIGVRSAPSQDLPYASASYQEAAKAADGIALAIPFTACLDYLPALADMTLGKVIIDSTNPLNPDWSPKRLGEENSAAEVISRLLPGAHVIKAFNTIFADVMDQSGNNGQAITAFIAGDNQEAKQQVMTLAGTMGYRPVDTGPLYTARYLESMAHLNIQLAVEQGGGTKAAFIYTYLG